MPDRRPRAPRARPRLRRPARGVRGVRRRRAALRAVHRRAARPLRRRGPPRRTWARRPRRPSPIASARAASPSCCSTCSGGWRASGRRCCSSSRTSTGRIARRATSWPSSRATCVTSGSPSSRRTARMSSPSSMPGGAFVPELVRRRNVLRVTLVAADGRRGRPAARGDRQPTRRRLAGRAAARARRRQPVLRRGAARGAAVAERDRPRHAGRGGAGPDRSAGTRRAGDSRRRGRGRRPSRPRAARGRRGAQRRSPRAAIDANILVREPGDRGVAFRHGLLGEVVYGRLLPQERRRLHHASPTALAATPGALVGAACLPVAPRGRAGRCPARVGGRRAGGERRVRLRRGTRPPGARARALGRGAARGRLAAARPGRAAGPGRAGGALRRRSPARDRALRGGTRPPGRRGGARPRGVAL